MKKILNEKKIIRTLIILTVIVMCAANYMGICAQKSTKDVINKSIDDELRNTKLGIAVNDYSSIKAEQDEYAEELGRLYQGDTAVVVADNGEWYEVLSGNIEGYVKHEELKIQENLGSLSDKKLEVASNVEHSSNLPELVTVATTTKITTTKNKKLKVSANELKYLACIIYAESSGESYNGKLAVANVVLNRYRSRSYPNTIKGVIIQKGQFSPYRNGALSRELKKYANGRYSKDAARKSALKAAKAALNGTNNVGSRKFFNGARVEAKKNHKNALRIGNHIFW